MDMHSRRITLAPLVFLGFVVAALNVAANLTGWAIYQAMGPVDKFIVHGAIGVLLSVVAVLALMFMISGREDFTAPRKTDWVYISGAALVWVSVIFTVLHALVGGEMTEPRNVIAIWLFQIVANGIALLIFHLTTRQRAAQPQKAHL